MTKDMHHQLEIVGDTATLYVSGSLDYQHVETLIRACDAAPLRSRTLRVDLHALGQLDAGAIGAVRQLLHFWRDSRSGDFRLTTSHLVATLHELPRHELPPRAILPHELSLRQPPLRETRESRTPLAAPSRASRLNDALAATFL